MDKPAPEGQYLVLESESGVAFAVLNSGTYSDKYKVLDVAYTQEAARRKVNEFNDQKNRMKWAVRALAVMTAEDAAWDVQ
jgi:acetate kinase